MMRFSSRCLESLVTIILSYNFDKTGVKLMGRYGVVTVTGLSGLWIITIWKIFQRFCGIYERSEENDTLLREYLEQPWRDQVEAWGLF